MHEMLDSSQIQSTLVGSLVKRLNSTTDISADLHIEVDQANFELRVENDSIVVRPARLSHLGILSKRVLKPLLGNIGTVKLLEEALERTGMTLYIYNRFAPILGPGANPLLRRLVFGVATSKS